MTLAPIERVPPDVLEVLARSITIEQQKTGERTRFIPTRAQRAWWESCYAHSRAYGLKPRQVHFTTATILDDAAFTWLNTCRGHSIETWLIWDTEAKVAAKIETISDMMTQLGWAHRHVGTEIVIDRGRLKPSYIRGITAGGRRAGAGLTAHRQHFSELPYYRDPEGTWRSMTPAQTLSSCVYIETTMAAGSVLGRRLWDDPNGFAKHFVPVEEHEAYRAEHIGGPLWRVRDMTVSVTGEIEAWLREEGFTRPDTIAWMAWALMDKAGGDRVELLREYPQTPEHCFNLASGRWIRCRPRVLPYRTELVERTAGAPGTRPLYLKIFRPLDQSSGQTLVSVDTAGEGGRNRHSCAVIDKRDGALCASWVGSGTEFTISDAAHVGVYAQRRYTLLREPEWPSPGEERIPPLIIEMNGVGTGTAQLAEAQGAHVDRMHADDTSADRGLLYVKAKAEAGILEGPEELAEEADELTREQKLGQRRATWKGRKDLIMACANAYWRLEQAPYEAPAVEPVRDVFCLEDRMRRTYRR